MDVSILVSEIARSVKERRGALGLTQAQLASMAGVSDRLVRLIEAGRAPGVGLEKLVAILAPLGLDLTIWNGSSAAGERPSMSRDNEYAEYDELLKRAVSSWTNTGDRYV